jgi:hypothetical protein
VRIEPRSSRTGVVCATNAPLHIHVQVQGETHIPLVILMKYYQFIILFNKKYVLINVINAFMNSLYIVYFIMLS